MTQPTMMELGYILMGMGDSSFHHFHETFEPQPSSYCLGYALGNGYMYDNAFKHGNDFGFINGFGFIYMHGNGFKLPGNGSKGNGNFLYKEIALEEIAFFHDRVKWKISRPVEIDSCVELIDKFLAQD